jgi:hypothetical protein
LLSLGHALIDQERARIVVAPKQDSAGFWFGSGNLIEDTDGTLYMSGRFRNYGDSRTGLEAGQRGMELAIFRSTDPTSGFEKIRSFSKQDLSHHGHEVISIEGSALRYTNDGVELYVSTEKTGYGYPQGLESFQKSGTGKWSIDVMRGASVEELSANSIETVLESEDPRFFHVKDPVIARFSSASAATADRDTSDADRLVFCTHPFNWSSSNSALAALTPDGPAEPDFTVFRRGFTWDVAISRITGITPVPPLGAFETGGSGTHSAHPYLVFYDGGECMRNLDAHKEAVPRPRGYSCEEIGGLAVTSSPDLADIGRLSINLPEFVSPTGSGSSRYAQAFATSHGMIALWQQSQENYSQPLVMNVLSDEELREILR